MNERRVGPGVGEVGVGGESVGEPAYAGRAPRVVRGDAGAGEGGGGGEGEGLVVPAEVEEVEVGGDGSCEGRSDRDGVRREHHVVLQDQDVGKFPALGVAESGEVREEATDGAGVPVLGVEVARLGELAFREGRTVHAGNPCESGGGGKVIRSRVRRWERNWALREGQCNDGRG